MKVLVTGANGFIGAHVVSALAEAGFSVVRAVRSPDGYGVPSGDIRNVAVLIFGMAPLIMAYAILSNPR